MSTPDDNTRLDNLADAPTGAYPGLGDPLVDRRVELRHVHLFSSSSPGRHVVGPNGRVLGDPPTLGHASDERNPRRTGM